jgi:hypothetical protein
MEQLNVVVGLNSKDKTAKISPFGRNDTLSVIPSETRNR